MLRLATSSVMVAYIIDGSALPGLENEGEAAAEQLIRSARAACALDT